jgi:hypothetical protein
MKSVMTALLPAVALLFGASMLPAASYADSSSLTSKIISAGTFQRHGADDANECPLDNRCKDAVDGVEDEDGPHHP